MFLHFAFMQARRPAQMEAAGADAPSIPPTVQTGGFKLPPGAARSTAQAAAQGAEPAQQQPPATKSGTMCGNPAGCPCSKPGNKDCGTRLHLCADCCRGLRAANPALKCTKHKPLAGSGGGGGASGSGSGGGEGKGAKAKGGK
jgi:hypothetical protein